MLSGYVIAVICRELVIAIRPPVADTGNPVHLNTPRRAEHLRLYHPLIFRVQSRLVVWVRQVILDALKLRIALALARRHLPSQPQQPTHGQASGGPVLEDIDVLSLEDLHSCPRIRLPRPFHVQVGRDVVGVHGRRICTTMIYMNAAHDGIELICVRFI